jgi:pantetheine-phosphate adenylyltransferase
LKKTAVFPGSFDPFTNAHLDLVEQALKVFDHIVIGIGVNSSKKGLFDTDTRLKMIEKILQAYPTERVSVKFFNGLTVDFCKKEKATFIIRGIRSIQDFESERAIAEHNRTLNPEIQTVFFVSPGNLSHISSTIIREIILNKGDVSAFVPKEILPFLHQ